MSTLSNKCNQRIENSLKAKRIYKLCRNLDEVQLKRVLEFVRNVTNIKT